MTFPPGGVALRAPPRRKGGVVRLPINTWPGAYGPYIGDHLRLDATRPSMGGSARGSSQFAWWLPGAREGGRPSGPCLSFYSRGAHAHTSDASVRFCYFKSFTSVTHGF